MEFVNFIDVCNDVTKTARKIPQSLYKESGKYAIFDQGKDFIGGYTDEEENVCNNYPYIVFGDHTRILKYINQPCYIGADGVKLLKVYNHKFNEKYVYYYLVANPVQSQGYSRHYKFLKSQSIKYIELEYQIKIVNEIDSLYKNIDLCNCLIKKLDNIVKSQFIEMFGDLTSNYDYPKFKIDDLAFVTKLAGFEFTEYINYQSSGDIIMLRGLNCKNGKLVLDDIKWIDVETSKKLPRSQLFNGDILMTYAGTVGDVALVDEDDKYHLAPNVAKISLTDKLSNNPVFFIHLFMFTKDYILSNTAGVAQMALSMKKIRDFEYHIPPIELQNKFADFVQQIDKSKFIVQKQIKLLEELLEKKMNEYFGQ